MLGGFPKWFQTLWEAVLLPYVVYALADLFMDGIEALRYSPFSLYVCVHFLMGRSHRSYPVRVNRRAHDQPAPAAPQLTEAVMVQRRLLLGKKGEQERWMEEVPGAQLVKETFRGQYHTSLQSLLRVVVGRIMEPTLPWGAQRHPPQWPSHYGLRRRHRIAGRSRAADMDYSSNNSSAVASTTETDSRPLPPSATHQHAKLVYRKVSSQQRDSKPPSARTPPPIVASISEDHVLSYQATRQKVLVIDLDETLCHAATSTSMMITGPTFTEVIPSTTSGGGELYHVWVRPHAQLFLRTMSKLFNLVLFTSATKPYADTILKHIDPDNLLADRFYRHNCKRISRGMLAQVLQKERQRLSEAATHDKGWTSATEPEEGAMSDASSTARGTPSRAPGGCDDDANGGRAFSDGEQDEVDKPPFDASAEVVIKDLRSLRVPPEMLIMIDNSEECTLLNRENALIISPFIPHRDRYPDGAVDDDDVLLALIPFLESLLVVPDVRTVLRHGKVYI